MDIVVNPITKRDRGRWAELWRGYLDFYETSLPPEIYDHTWQRLIVEDGPIRGLGARIGSASAPLVGIAHYLFHGHAWTALEVCYLQDLFVDAAVRRSGVGRRLIGHSPASGAVWRAGSIRPIGSVAAPNRPKPENGDDRSGGMRCPPPSRGLKAFPPYAS